MICATDKKRVGAFVYAFCAFQVEPVCHFSLLLMRKRSFIQCHDGIFIMEIQFFSKISNTIKRQLCHLTN